MRCSRTPARALSLSPTAPFLPTAEEMGERTPAETTFLHFLSALCLFAAARAFPHVTGVFLIVVVPPTVPAQLSAAAARCYGKLFCSLVLRDKQTYHTPCPQGTPTFAALRRQRRDLIIATRPAHPPLPSLLSAAAAQAVQAIPRTDNVPRRANSAKPAPPNLHLPAPRQGVLRP